MANITQYQLPHREFVKSINNRYFNIGYNEFWLGIRLYPDTGTTEANQVWYERGRLYGACRKGLGYDSSGNPIEGKGISVEHFGFMVRTCHVWGF